MGGGKPREDQLQTGPHYPQCHLVTHTHPGLSGLLSSRVCEWLHFFRQMQTESGHLPTGTQGDTEDSLRNGDYICLDMYV